MKNKRSNEDGSQKVEHIRAKHKSPTETVAPVQCVFCGEKEVFVKKDETASEITRSRVMSHRFSYATFAVFNWTRERNGFFIRK